MITMSKTDEKTTKPTDIELSTQNRPYKSVNGSVQNSVPIENSEMSPHTKPKRRTKWASVRNVIKVTSVVRNPKKKGSMSRQDSFLKKFSTRQHYKTESEDSHDSEEDSPDVVFVHNDITVFKPDGSHMFYWLLIVTIAVLYNLWTCIVRQAFRELQEEHRIMWITLDVVSDVIYVLDIVAQLRTGYLEQGLMVLDAVKLAKRYVHSCYFKIDLISLFPLDFLQFVIGWQPLLRFPRFLKVYRALRFLYMLETRTAYPNFVRVANLTHMLFLGCHWFAAFYFMISEAEGFHSEWSYPEPSGSHNSLTRKYLASLFWSTLTLTTIGDLPPPETNWEYVFVIGSYLIGVFIFATIVGQVGNVITNRNASRLEFERLLDGAKLYMRMHNVPPPVQRRVQRWYDYVWTRGRMTGSDINSLGLLPDKLKTELAIHVNLETLKKVTIFNECQPEFLHDLVLKMKAYIFTPGDLICRRGEVAREMFIIADGVVEIISESGSILTQMSTGNFFGEIGILNLDGGINRRTADVKSVGYSELFVLSREDVLEALKDHPDAKELLVEHGKKRLKEHMEKQRQQYKTEIIRKYAEQRLKQVLQDRKKLQETKAMTPPIDTTLNHLLVFPRHSVLSLKDRRKSSNISMKSQKSTGKLCPIFRRRKSRKSKYKVGTSYDSEPKIYDINGDSTRPVISVSDHSDPNACMPDVQGQACVVNDSDKQNNADDPVPNSDACLTSLPLLNIVHRHVQAAALDKADCYCQRTDIATNNLDLCSNNENDSSIADNSEQFSDERSVASENQNDSDLLQSTDQMTSQTCCRCGQLEDKLYKIQKQLTSVEKLYQEGIKQLETFNDINEKYVKLLNMIPECQTQNKRQVEQVNEEEHKNVQKEPVRNTQHEKVERIQVEKVKYEKPKQLEYLQEQKEHVPDRQVEKVQIEQCKRVQNDVVEYVQEDAGTSVRNEQVKHVQDELSESDQNLQLDDIKEVQDEQSKYVHDEQVDTVQTETATTKL